MFGTSFWGTNEYGPSYWGGTSTPGGTGAMPLDCYSAVRQSLDSDPLAVDPGNAVLTG